MPDTTYLDHAATTPVRPEVIAAVSEQLGRLGNASSLHASGRAARRVVEESRELIAERIGASPSEVIFTSGGTEADNIAIKGTYWERRNQHPQCRRVAVSAIEHHAVLDPVDYLVEQQGAAGEFIGVDHDGRVDVEAVDALLGARPQEFALLSVMWANNEVGTVQPVPELAAVASAYGIPFHTDAVQAVGQVPVDFAASGADLMTITGHKLGGPQGIGALIAARTARPVPLTHGGGQERQIRSGTLDVAGIRGLAVAVDAAVGEQADEAARLVLLRDRLLTGALALDLDIEVSGPWTPGSDTDRLPGNAHILVPGCDGDSLLYLLDAAGIACSTGSACQAGVPQPSHVLLAMGYAEQQARGALRLTLGRTSTDADVAAVLAALPQAVERARRAHHATARVS